MMRFVLFIVALMIASPMAAYAEGDAAAGEKVFRRCKACHVADKDLNKTGPTLLGVIGRQAGTLESFKKYSKAMIAAGDEGLVWDTENMAEFLRKPKTYIKGSKMAFAGLKKEDQIADVIAYIAQFSE